MVIAEIREPVVLEIKVLPLLLQIASSMFKVLIQHDETVSFFVQVFLKLY
jgi:hypothetical protein